MPCFEGVKEEEIRSRWFLANRYDVNTLFRTADCFLKVNLISNPNFFDFFNIINYTSLFLHNKIGKPKFLVDLLIAFPSLSNQKQVYIIVMLCIVADSLDSLALRYVGITKYVTSKLSFMVTDSSATTTVQTNFYIWYSNDTPYNKHPKD